MIHVRTSLSLLVVLGLGLAPVAHAGKKRQERQAMLEQVAPWATDPDGVKLEIVERLVLETKQYDKALPIIAAMRQEGVNAPVLDLVQGIAMREEGLRDEAETMLLQARKRMPSDPRVHEALCVLYADAQRLDAAVAACEKATKVDSERASAWNNLGYLYAVTDRPTEAVEAAKQAVALNGAEPRYRNNLGIAVAASGDTTGALEIFRTTSSEADAYHNLGFAVERYQSAEDALRWYRRALEVNDQHVPSARAIERLTNPDPKESPE